MGYPCRASESKIVRPAVCVREKWGDGEMGRWGDGEMGRWGDGEMGRWGDGTGCVYVCVRQQTNG
jgi:hypothetical protein